MKDVQKFLLNEFELVLPITQKIYDGTTVKIGTPLVTGTVIDGILAGRRTRQDVIKSFQHNGFDQISELDHWSDLSKPADNECPGLSDHLEWPSLHATVYDASFVVAYDGESVIDVGCQSASVHVAWSDDRLAVVVRTVIKNRRNTVLALFDLDGNEI